MPEFSPLQRPPFSKYWDEEEEAFSAWLADEENIRHLRDVLGLHGLVAEELKREVEGYFVDNLLRKSDESLLRSRLLVTLTKLVPG